MNKAKKTKFSEFFVNRENEEIILKNFSIG